MTPGTLSATADAYRRPLSLGNPLLDLQPIAMVTAITSLIVVAVASPGWALQSAVSVLFVVIAFLAGRGRSYLATILKLWVAVGFLLFALRALLVKGQDVLVPLGPIAVTREGIQDGLVFTTAVMAICGGVTLFFAIVSMRRLTLALERVGMSPRATYVVLASFQSITDLGETARVVLAAQKARGIETEGNVLVRARAFFPVLAPVFITAMSATEERAIALDARAFNSPNRHTSVVLLRPWSAGDTVVVVVALVLMVAVVLGRVVGWF
ncbi:MAG TPA: energy-coupling factor transporter transmembrane component T [Amnibacterium sp.]|jgi:energy-coupling factor transporter transmembrane protein EcfT|nr:energy-coupling factor transporter transmembrane component T [Amnibacterium sp.]